MTDEYLKLADEIHNLDNPKWDIDTSTGTPILVYEKCSVIQDEQANEVLRAFSERDELKAKLEAAERETSALREIMVREHDTLTQALGNGADESAWEPGEHYLLAVIRGLKERDELKAKLEAADQWAADHSEYVHPSVPSKLVKALEDVRICLYYSRKPANEILKEIDDTSFAALEAYKEGK